MKTAVETKRITSRPTMCLRCHLVLAMMKGERAWVCPHCGADYPFKFWKIKPGGRQRELDPVSDEE
jgi:hypothetical protein